MEGRITRDEFQDAVGNLRAEMYTIQDEFWRDRISRDVYLQRLSTLRQAGRRFHNEFRQAHRIMAVPMREEQGVFLFSNAQDS
jgi:hypothetical protein